METIYKKSKTGQEEVASRAHGLSARLRRCLILLDGKRTVAELKILLSGDDVDLLLSELEIDGYIEFSSESTNASNEVPPSPVIQTQKVEQSNEYNDTQNSVNAARRNLTFQERKLRGRRILQDTLGPMGEDIAIKIERAVDDVVLDKHLEDGYQLIKEIRGKATAYKYRLDVRLI